MKKTKILVGLTLIPLVSGALIGCTGTKKELSETGKAVEAASKMTFDELKEASKKEWEEKPNGVFKAFGLTSVLNSVMTTIAKEYDWIVYTNTDKKAADVKEGDNCYVKSNYKDQALLTTVKEAENNYICDYVLIQDRRSFATYLEDGILHNFVPKDAVSDLGFKKVDTNPLRGIWFNKLFWTNTNYEKAGGVPIKNVWQFAGEATDEGHISKVSFQNASSEAINMSFLLTAMSKDNEGRLKDAYKSFYKKDWKATSEYKTIGEQWTKQFIKNIKIFHESDGTCMKETQIRDKWNDTVVYYGAFSKMKDAVALSYDVDLDGDGAVEDEIDLTVTCGGKDYHYTSEKQVNAMSTVKWDYEIEGFNGFMYSMDSEIVEHANYPYTACLFARTLAIESVYTSAISNKATPTAAGTNGNQYGYYYPGAESASFPYAKGDWTKAEHEARELREEYDYLANVKESVVNELLALLAQ